ncbi:MAG: ion transporter [Alistipes sp.]|nr:ion transporter [Alistipes sp.]
MTKTEQFKKQLARVFDSNLRTKQWENYVDYAIIGLICLSTISVFISTFEVSPLCERVLQVIDLITVIAFTIEVSLRIWAADESDEEYKGFWGRVKYCFSFYGLVDILSTYTFYVSLFIPLPYAMLKSLRVLRLLRVFRYMHSFKLLQQAITSKSREMFVSLQFLVVVTVMLSFVLFFYEHAAQPEVYDNGIRSVVWAFAQYVGDPGGFADTPPITFAGRIIACIIGLLGIALFAVPAGLIGAGFSEAMEDEKLSQKIKRNISSIIHSFKFVKDQQHTNLFFSPRYKEVNTIITRKFIPYEDILETVKESDCLHIYDLANSVNNADHPESKLVIINFVRNRPYGTFIDRGSKVTIVSTSGHTEPATGWLAYHIAKLGGFNYIAKEIESDIDNPTSYYNIPDGTKCPNLPLFIEDLKKLADRPDSWVIPILEATGLRSRPTQFHFCYNSTKHDSSYNDPTSLVKDYKTFDALYNHMEQTFKERFDYNCDKNEWYAIGKQNIGHHITASNIFTLRVEAFVWIFDNRWGSATKTIADCFHEILEPERPVEIPYEMEKRQEGHDFGMQDYVD